MEASNQQEAGRPSSLPEGVTSQLVEYSYLPDADGKRRLKVVSVTNVYGDRIPEPQSQVEDKGNSPEG